MPLVTFPPYQLWTNELPHCPQALLVLPVHSARRQALTARLVPCVLKDNFNRRKGKRNAKAAHLESTLILKGELFVANALVALSRLHQVEQDVPPAQLVNTHLLWVQQAIYLAPIAPAVPSPQLVLRVALLVLREHTRPTPAAPARRTAWDVPLERMGPSRLLTVQPHARLALQAHIPLLLVLLR